jgi:hypothetical protein
MHPGRNADWEIVAGDFMSSKAWSFIAA